ncbi:Small ribosomal subunit biogenesis GTPase RsgA [Paraconexibacter sp. AEG42_29]|uniref:Small ribosomal subunit biogenesis GTPase RsgA n=1 Tax=Paraconexibacter sp. AEG42_29 TaxID=2997339 RepID=A0AAU7B1N2_9ACTN
MNPSWEGIVAEAIRQSSEAAAVQLDAIHKRAADWTGRLSLLETEHGSHADAHQAAPTLAQAVTESVDHSLEGLRRRQHYLGSLHLVLFGRTGAGKSSFVEALTRGTGQRISPEGRLDFTTTVDEVAWGSVVVVDTPGIEGWADDGQRDVIEAEAHAAVQRADVVILVFDDYNQKVREFQQIAEWVALFGKVAIAILNVRDDEWRYDARLYDPDDREPAVQQIREHAGHIDRMLRSVGLEDVPIIAANLAWAFGARASEIGRHPAAAELERARDELTPIGLERVSNFDAFEDLMTALLSGDPASLRLGGLERERVTALHEIQALLRREERAAALLADQRELAVRTVLGRTGAPRLQDLEEIEPGADQDSVSELVSLLADDRYADVRDERGEVARLMTTHLDGPITAARSNGLTAARAELQQHDGRFASVSAQRLQTVALKAAAFDDVAARHSASALMRLAKDIAADAESLRADFVWEVRDFETGFDADTGRGRRSAGKVLGFGSAGGAAVAAVLAASNPLGWALGIGFVGGALARKLRRSGHRKRTEERLRVERELGTWLHGVAQDVQGAARTAGERQALILAGRAATADARQAARHRADEALLREVRRDVQAAKKEASAAAAPSELIEHAVATVEVARYPDDPDAGPKVWLGEDWLDTPSETATRERPRLDRPRLGDMIVIRTVPATTSERFWLAAERLAATGPELSAAVNAGRAVLAADPVVGFVGDFSSGKTSLIRRLATTWGVELSEHEFAVGAAPTTESIIEMRAGGLIVRDTPGLGSGDAEHDRIALAAVASASLLVVTHTPVGGRLDDIVDLLSPDGRALRTVHVLGRIDALSARPHTDPEGFMSLLEVKRSELARKLEASGLPPHADLPLPVAADPGRRHSGGRPWQLKDFLPFNGWDGIDDLSRVLFREAQRGRASAAIDCTRDAALRTCARLAADLDGMDLRSNEIQRVIDIYRRAADAHGRAEQRAAHALHAVMSDAVAERLEDLADMDTTRLRAVQQTPDSWLVTERLEGDFADWRDGVLGDLEQVYAELEQAVEARVGSRAFAAAFGDGAGATFDDFTKVLLEGLKAAAGKGAGAGEKFVAGLAAKIPALAGFAEQLGKAAARGAAAAAGLVLEAGAQALEDRAERRRADTMEDAKKAIHEAADAWVTETLEGTDTTASVLSEVVAFAEQMIHSPLASMTQAHDDVANGRAATTATVAAAENLILEANRALN